MNDDKIEYAIYYATKAHKGQRRKLEDIDMIFHPFTVGMILQRNGCKEEIVCAGILHDVVEDTPYTFEDIEKEFGKQVRDYVYDASEPDKTLSWEERKEHTIEHIKTAPLGSKLIVACDKISNLNDTYASIQKYGEEEAWKVLKRPKDKQQWYYSSVYNSCIEGADKNHPIFKRYKEILDKVFGGNKMERVRGFEVAKGFEDKEINLPVRKTKYSAGYDIEAAEDVVIPSFKHGMAPTLVKTGIKAYMQDDEFLALYNRSSNPKKKGLILANSVGIIDKDYYGNSDNDGHIMFAFYNVKEEDTIIKKGEAIGQGIFQKFFVTDNDIADGERTGGFGSTNK